MYAIEKKNLVCIHFLYQTNITILKLFESLKIKHCYDIMTVMTIYPPYEMHGYKEKLCCYYLDNFKDIDLLTKTHSENKEHSAGYKIILASPFECPELMQNFEADWFLNVSSFDKALKKLDSILGSYFNATQ